MSSSAYQGLTPEQHVRKRPGMYITGIENIIENKWFCDKDGRMVCTDIEYNPGLYKIICEAIDNAGDHSERTNQTETIKINYNEDTGEFVIYNDGPGINHEINQEHGIPNPQLIFGKLFTSSNYDDSEDRTWIGTNGIGIKATNIFSTSFKVETVYNKKKYTQKWSNGMQTVKKHKITTTVSKDYTKISFVPDYEAFSAEEKWVSEIQDLIQKMFNSKS